MDCLFCKIAAGEIPSNKVFEDDLVYAFYDIAPAAPVHVLVIPKEHIAGGVDELDGTHAKTLARIFAAIGTIAGQLGLSGGYRVVSNVGEDAGQTVRHLHFHILAGGPLGKMA